MLVVKKTGLVPVISTKRDGKDDIFGVKPAVALAGLKAGELVLADIPDDIETFELRTEPDVVVEIPKDVKGPIAIPEGWADAHKLSWIKLAEEILGHKIVLTDEQKQAEVKVSDVAKGIIEAEIQRRAAAETPAE